MSEDGASEPLVILQVRRPLRGKFTAEFASRQDAARGGVFWFLIGADATRGEARRIALEFERTGRASFYGISFEEGTGA